jgi:hypothetical protein
MGDRSAIAPQHLATLSRLMFQGYAKGDFSQPQAQLPLLLPDLRYIGGLGEQERGDLLRAADLHHVSVRALRVVQRAAMQANDSKLSTWCEQHLATEGSRIKHAVGFLERICTALEAAACPTVVIKSLDHWPDLGSDLDLYTSADEQSVVRVMREQFQAEQEPRSWGDRLANKFNFAVPGLPELVEVHVRYLGQTGEHTRMAQRLIERRVTRTIDGHSFRVPAPEERVVVSTLQRMYRHFYFRLCDMADVAALLQRNELDFVELRRAADSGGIWPGVATFLFLVAQYAAEYGGEVNLPSEVIRSSYSPVIRVQLGGNFLRVPKLPAASLYGAQLLNAGRKGDVRAMTRLPLLPPLAISALLAYRVTGSDKGIW